MYSSLKKINAILLFILCFCFSPVHASAFEREDLSKLTLEIKEDRVGHLTGYFWLTDVQELIAKKAPKVDFSQIKEEAYKEDIKNLLASKIFIFVNKARCYFIENNIEFLDGERIFIHFQTDTLPEVIKNCQIDVASLHTESNSSYSFTVLSSVLQDSAYLNRGNFYTEIFPFPYKKEKNLDFGRLYLIGGVVLAWIIFIFWLIRNRKDEDY